MKTYLPFIFACLIGALHAQTPASAPESFSRTLTHDGATITIDFEKFSVRGPHFDVIKQTTADADFVDHTHDSVVRTYLGSIQGRPGALAAGMIRANGEVLTRVTFADFTEWSEAGGTMTSQGSISTRGTAHVATRPSTVIIRDGGAGSTVYASDVMIDLPLPQITSSGGDEDHAVEMAEYAMMCINISYLRDAAILNRVGLIILRMDVDKDPYKGDTSTNQMLDQIRLEGMHFTGIDNPRGRHDLALTASSQVGGGLAWVGVVGSNNNGYSSNGANGNGDFSVVARHELGHNWGSNHFEGGGQPEGPTIMSGNSLGTFSSGELTKILNHRDSRLGILDIIPTTDIPALPPRAATDTVIAEIGSSPVTVNVLTNDSDTNGGLLTVTTFDATSTSGHSITESAGTLTIPINSDYSPQPDRINYTISDSSSKTSNSQVFVNTYMDGDTLGHWTFENDTSRALDSSSYLNHGTLGGDAFIQDGALTHDGSGDSTTARLTRPVESNTITYAAMVYRDGDQNDWAGIIRQVGNSSTGLNFGPDNELRYHWESSSNWGYDSNLTVPDRTWTFVALVIEPTRATFYMDPGTGMQSVSRTLNHSVRTHSSYGLAFQPTSGSRVMTGMLDDARIINRALSAAEITALAADGLGACDPIPLSGAQVSTDSLRLRWTKSALASSQRLFISQSYTTLRDAITGSPEDQGPVTESFDATNLTNGHYYWRVDSTEPNGTVKGHIWTFEKRDDSLIAHYPFDQITSGTPDTTVCTGCPDHDAFVIGDPSLCTDAPHDNGIELNTGTNTLQYITVPKATLAPLGNEVTIAFWAKGHGPSLPRANNVFEAFDSNSNRILSSHLPWSDSVIYWDAGNATGYDRISKTAPATLTEDVWTHWVFTKDASAGTMNIYANGELFQTGTGKSRPFDSAVEQFRIGRAASRTDRWWPGCLDDFRIYSNALGADAAQRLYRDGVPYYQWAKQHFSPLDYEDNSISAPDISQNLLHYALNTDPAAPDTSLMPQAGGEGFSFTRRKDIPRDLSYTIEMSSTLQPNSWDDMTTLWEEYAPRENGPNSTERLFIRPVDQTTGKMFFRLRLER